MNVLKHSSQLLRLACCATFFAASAHCVLADTINVSVNGGTATSSVTPSYVNNFNTATLGTPSTYMTTFGNSGVTGTYTGSFALTTNKPYAGDAGGTYITTGGNAPAPGAPANFTLTLSSNITYFGFYLGAFDSGNQLALFNGNTQVGTVSNATLASLFAGCPTCSYSGDTTQPYGFVNISDLTGSFNKIEFIESPYSGQNFETDNHTIGGIVPTPEPGSLALLGTGVLTTAGMIRRRIAKA